MGTFYIWISDERFGNHCVPFEMAVYMCHNSSKFDSSLTILEAVKLQFFSIAFAHFWKQSYRSLNYKCNCHNCLMGHHSFFVCLQKVVSHPKQLIHTSKPTYCVIELAKTSCHCVSRTGQNGQMFFHHDRKCLLYSNFIFVKHFLFKLTAHCTIQ